MSYAQRLIGRILADERARGGKLADEKVYRDEPILRTGSDLLKERQREQAGRAGTHADARANARGSASNTARVSVRERTGKAARSSMPRNGNADKAEAEAGIGAAHAAMRDARRSTAPLQGALFPWEKREPSPHHNGRDPLAPTRAAHRSSAARSGGGWRAAARPDAAPRDRSWQRGSSWREASIPQPVEEPCDLPAPLEQLRVLERKADALILPESRLFFDQALLTAGYEDDFRYDGKFHCYFPTYRQMSDQQLRGYFAWRTAWRRGQHRQTSLSFAFVHLYELLNRIGPDGLTDPESGYRALQAFARDYGALDPFINRHTTTWLHDYVIYHDLDLRLLSGTANAEDGNAFALFAAKRQAEENESEAPEAVTDGGGGAAAPGTRKAASAEARANAAAHADENGQNAENERKRGSAGAQPLPHDEALAVLLRDDREGNVPDDELFAALASLSAYRVGQSRLLREDAPALKTTACGTWRALSAYYRAHRKRTLFEHLFGVRSAQPYPMFRAAVFHAPEKHPDTVREVGPICRFVCKNGRWTCERFHRAETRSRELGAVLKAVDATLRERLGCAHPLKDAAVPKYVQGIIDKQAAALLATRDEREEQKRRQAEERARRTVSIDRAKLQGIRQAAALTCEALLVDEERDGGAAALDAAPKPSAASQIEGGGEAEGETRPSSDAEHHAAAEPSAANGTAAAIQPEAAPADACDGNGNPSASAPNPAGPLSPAEAAYVRCLLAGAPPTERKAAAQAAGVPESMMMDAINEKLFDELGDVALEEGDDGPRVVEDYEEDVRGIVQAC